jgi:putative NADH-flavin reductase
VLALKVLVIGATGNLGSQVVARALEAGHAVTALARDAAKIRMEHESLRVAQGDARNLDSLGPAVDGQEAVISCLGTSNIRDRTLRTEGARNTILAMREHGVSRLVVFSAFGAGESLPHLKRSAPFFGRIIVPFLLKASFEDMGRMEEEVSASGLDWTIVRPTALTKKPGTGNVKVVLDETENPGGGIPYADVANFMVEQLTSDAYLHKAPAISS